MRRIIPILLSLLLVLSLPLAAFAAIGDTLSLTEGELSITDESTYDDITVTGGELYIHGVRVSLNGAKYGTNTIAVSGGTLRLEDAWLSGNSAATLNITGGLITGSGIYNEKPSRVAAGTVNITGGIVQLPDILGFDILIDGNCAVIVEKIANFGNYTDIPYTFNKGLLIVGNSGTVKGEVTLPGAVTVKSGVTLDFVNGAKVTNPQLLTIEEGATILIDGQPCTHATYENGICTVCDGYQPAELNSDNVYEIGNAGQLLWFAELVNSAPAELIIAMAVKVDAKLTADIDMTGLPWIPIGKMTMKGNSITSCGFGGTFDGCGHTVSGIDCTVTANGSSSVLDSPDAGFFGCTDQATIRNLMVIGSFTARYTGTNNSPTACAGGIVAYAENSIIENCGYVGTLSAEGRNMTQVGGIAGHCRATLISCWSAATVESTGADVQYIGGLVGYGSSGTYENCYYDSTLCTLTASYKGDLAGVTGKTSAQFASGEVAYLLNGSTSEGDLVWFQTIGTHETPSFIGEKVYYGYTCCGDAEMVYTNISSVSQTKPEHTGGTATCHKQAVCDLCGASYGEKDTTNHDSTFQFDTNGLCPNGCYQPAELNADNVYEIGNAGQLLWFAELVNSAPAELIIAMAVKVDAKLTADIDMTGLPWIPIGQKTTEGNWVTCSGYGGTFDGCGHAVSGIDCTVTVNGGNSVKDSPYAGFFANTNQATIRNLMVIGSFTARYTGTDHSPMACAGGIVAYASNSIIENCGFVGTLSAECVRMTQVGGIAGSCGASLINCWSAATVESTGANLQHIGGLAGVDKYGTYENCYYDSTLCTLPASSEGDLTGVTGKTSAQFASGEVAYLLNGSTSEGDPVWFQTIGTHETPSFIGEKVYYGYTSCGDAEMVYTNISSASQTKPEHTGGTATCHKQAVCDLCGASYGEKDTTNHDSTVQFDTNGFCPNGCYQPAELNSDNVYEIGNAGQLYWFAHQVNHDNANFGSANAILTADIQVNQNVLNPDGTLAADVSDFRVWTPIGFNQVTSSGSVVNAYSGTFDGAGHTISGLYFTGYADYNTKGCAFIGQNEGTVKNLGLLDSYISSQHRAGGIVDGNDGTITDCYNFATVIGQDVVGGVVASNPGTISGCYNAGMILGEYNTGGVVGQIMFAGFVENCYNTGIVGGDVGNSYVGGIVGSMWTFESSETPILRNCWNNGVVTGEVAVGTIAGHVDGGVIENCYYLSDTETDTFDGTTAKTSAQFASGEVTFLLGEAFGQNIDNGGENQGYPVFSDATVFCGYTDCVDVTPGYSNTRLYPRGSGHSAPNADGCCDHCGNLLSASVTIGETTTYYLDIQEAIDAAETGTEELPARLTFLVDMDLWGDTSNLEINTGVITVDLNGHTIMSQTGSILNIGNPNEDSDAVVTITDSSQEQTGTIFANGYGMGIRCFGGHLILESGNIRVEDDDKLLATGIRVMGGELTITGGYIYAQTNGTRYPAKGVDLVEDSTGTITGGKLVSTIAVNADNDLTVSGDVILSGSQYAIQCQGDLVVTGGTISGTTGDIWHNAASGTFVLGIDQDTGLGATFPGGITISGGTLEGVLAEGAAYWQDGLQLKVDEEATVITGGDVTVKAVCDHSGNTNTIWKPSGFSHHSLSCSICGYYAATEPHNIDHDTGICQVCDFQPLCAVTVDGNTTYCVDRAFVPELLAEATDNSIVEIKLYMDWIGSYISQRLTFDRGIVTLDINGCTMDARIMLKDAQLTIVDTAEVKGTILNNGGAMAEIDGGKLIIDVSADYWGQAEGHENWLIMKGHDNDKVFTIGSTGIEDIVLPQGTVALDNTVGTVWAETNVLSDEIYHICLHIHADADNDHDCDDCGKILSECADADKNHKCDLCGAELSKCADADKNHKCDLCGTELSKCADADKDHNCDTCGTELSKCVDENKDYKCDICGAELEKPVIEDVTRLAGANRWETSLKVADEMKANLGLEKFDAIIIASGNDFADALAGSYLSTVKNAPILLGWGKGGKYVTLDEANIAYIKANLAEGGTVYILGGKNAVPELYETELKGYNVKRLGGANRFETNLLILEEAGVAEGSEVLVCTSTNFADSLSASATAKPILLVFNEYGKLYGKQPDFLAGLKNCTFTVIGGESAVSADLAKAIEAYGKVERLAGANRFETSVLVAQKYFASPETAVLAYAWNYPDGLCGGSLAFSLKAPLILTMTKYEAKAAEYMTKAGIEIGLVLGGDTLISDEAVRSIFAMDAADGIVKK